MTAQLAIGGRGNSLRPRPIYTDQRSWKAHTAYTDGRDHAGSSKHAAIELITLIQHTIYKTNLYCPSPHIKISIKNSVHISHYEGSSNQLEEPEITF